VTSLYKQHRVCITCHSYAVCACIRSLTEVIATRVSLQGFVCQDTDGDVADP